MMNTAIDFRKAIEQAGLTPPPSIIEDGKLHRFASSSDRTDDSGWYTYFSDENPAGAFGCWRAGLKQTWTSKSDSTLTTAERERQRARLDEARRQRDYDEQLRHADAAQQAQAIWSQAAPAPADHPYLLRKQVQPHGLRVDAENRLIVPVMIDGTLASLQFIDSDSEKKKLFLFGGKKRGGSFPLGDLTEATTILIAEGYATAASLREASGLPVVVAFDAGNLKPVALALRAAYPGSTLCLCADDDAETEGNPGITKATEAVDAVAGRLIVPCFGADRPVRVSDFNDLAALRGLGAVRVAIEGALRREEPLLISLDEAVLPALPIEAFPQVLGAMVHAVAQATETPLELAAMMGLVTVATCCQKSFVVEGSPGYSEPLCLWTVAALESGNRKTAVLMRMTAPLVEHERDLRAKGETDRAAKESARLTVEAQVKALRNRIATSEDIGDIAGLKANLSELESTMPAAPTVPQLWAQDVTPEKLAVLMADNGEAMALLSDEGGLFDMMAGRYSNGIPNLDLYLQSHARARVRVDRGSRPQVDLSSPVLTIGISPQPSVLRGLTRGAGFRERGLLARFLYALPASTLGYRRLSAPSVPDSVATDYGAMIQALLTIEPAEDDSGRVVPMTLRLSAEAQGEWLEFARAVEGHLRPGGDFEYLKDWAGKLPGAALRVAGLFHCVTHADHTPHNQNISHATLTQALTMLMVLSKHTKAVFDLMGADPALEGARKVMAWAQRARMKSFSAHDCYEALRGSFPTMALLAPALKLLVERRQLLQVDCPYSGKGRPQSQGYTVHAELTKRWAC